MNSNFPSREAPAAPECPALPVGTVFQDNEGNILEVLDAGRDGILVYTQRSLHVRNQGNFTSTEGFFLSKDELSEGIRSGRYYFIPPTQSMVKRGDSQPMKVTHIDMTTQKVILSTEVDGCAAFRILPMSTVIEEMRSGAMMTFVKGKRKVA